MEILDGFAVVVEEIPNSIQFHRMAKLGTLFMPRSRFSPQVCTTNKTHRFRIYTHHIDVYIDISVVNNYSVCVHAKVIVARCARSPAT